MCCAAQFLTLTRAACHQGTAVGSLRGRVRNSLPTSLPQAYTHTYKVNSVLRVALLTQDCGSQSHLTQHKGIWAMCPEQLLHHLTMLGHKIPVLMIINMMLFYVHCHTALRCTVKHPVQSNKTITSGYGNTKHRA